MAHGTFKESKESYTPFLESTHIPNSACLVREFMGPFEAYL